MRKFIIYWFVKLFMKDLVKCEINELGNLIVFTVDENEKEYFSYGTIGKNFYFSIKNRVA